jgi:hypothetical protein
MALAASVNPELAEKQKLCLFYVLAVSSFLNPFEVL